MRILAVSDIESDFIWDYFDETRFEGVDLIISCGDLKSDYLSFLATMIKAPVFYVHGNHDSNYVQFPPEGCDSIEDQIIEYKGVRIVGLGGSIKYNNHPTQSRPPYQFTERQMEKRIRRIKRKLFFKKKGFDILVTHSPAFGIDDGTDACHTGFKCFLPFLEKYKPRLMLHGHMHMKYGRAQRSLQHGPTQIIDAFGYYILDI